MLTTKLCYIVNCIYFIVVWLEIRITWTFILFSHSKDKWESLRKPFPKTARKEEKSADGWCAFIHQNSDNPDRWWGIKTCTGSRQTRINSGTQIDLWWIQKLTVFEAESFETESFCMVYFILCICEATKVSNLIFGQNLFRCGLANSQNG